MNTLSWFIYLADVIGNVQGWLISITIVLSAAVVLSLMWVFHHNDFCKKDERVPPFFFVKKVIIPIIILGTIATFIPNKETVYLILTSELGETTINTPEVKAIFSDLQEILQIQLDNLKGK